MQIRRNGQNTTRKSSKDYGAFVHMEPLARVFAEEHFPEDGGGNVYKK